MSTLIMIEKQIKVSVGIETSKNMRARLSLLMVETATGEVISEQFHSIFIEPGADLAALRQANEAHLAMPFSVSGIKLAPWPKIPDAEWAEVVAHVGIAHKPSVVREFRARVAAAAAAAAAAAENADATAIV